MDQKLKAGVIGLGLLGTSHSAYLSQHPKVELVAGADVREQAANEAKAKFTIQVYSDYAAMLTANDLDLVVVATPDPLHKDPVAACAQAKIPYIVVEKPLATTVADGQEMLAACQTAGSKLWVHLNNRVNPMDIAARYIIQEGLLGAVAYGEARLDDNISVPRRLWGERRRDWAATSSTAHFLLSHTSDTMRWLFEPAEVEAVYAITQHQVLGYSPDLYDAYLFFNNGLKLRIKADWIKYMEGLVEYYKCFSGDKGTLFYNKIPGFNVKEASLQANFDDLPVEQLLRHQEALKARGARVHVKMLEPRSSVGGGIMPQLEMDAQQPPATRLMDHILNSIFEGKPVPDSWAGNGRLPTGEDGLAQTKIVCAIIESANKRQEVLIA